MLNKCILLGRMCANAEIKVTPSGVKCATFSVAVERDYKSSAGTRETDFVPCIAWREKADFMEKYFSKGDMIALCGSIQSNRYTGSDGKQHTSYVVMVENISFAGSKKTETAQSKDNNKDNNFETIAEDEKLPF